MHLPQSFCLLSLDGMQRNADLEWQLVVVLRPFGVVSSMDPGLECCEVRMTPYRVLEHGHARVRINHQSSIL
jgi:hypothetical protein